MLCQLLLFGDATCGLRLGDVEGLQEPPVEIGLVHGEQLQFPGSLQNSLGPIRRAGQGATHRNRTGKGESKWERLDRGTCLGEPASLCRKSKGLEEADDARVLEEAGGSRKAL